jgi:RNA polymerase sigma-70 factor (ECF subfamily)
MNTTLEPRQIQQEASDLALMEQAFIGNQAAFEQLVHRYQHMLSRFVWARLGNETASDVMQFVWLQFYLTLPKLIHNQRSDRQEASIKPWLFRIAYNRCIDEHRKDTRHPWVLFSDLEQGDEDEYASVLDTLLDTTPLPEEIAEHQDDSEHLRTAIRSLPSKFRHVVELRYTQELTFGEIGHQLSIPPTTAQTYFYRACKKLRYTLAS